MHAAYDAGLREPCRDCGTTGGHTRPHGGLPTRSRGLCQSCESRHAKQGTLNRYPLMTGNDLLHPRIPRHYLDPYMLGSDRDQHAVLPGYDWEAVWSEAVAYAERWLADPGRRARALAWLWAQGDAVAAHLLFVPRREGEVA